ncbi:hypothetical protein [Paraburkholderia caledonica]|uniref:GNAT family N-acetyltransferase n=1 Tax=Paraburkholderia caledonica TaxID=134536 RepID=A0ABU1KYU6_9BURK|nr:hypothetical protein [Paraburkholderia caledonica]MDR6376093.1 hypothetical protein [Paraburkholderia caledonica]
MPDISVINESTTYPTADIQGMMAAFTQQWNHDLRPVWGVDAATFTMVPAGHAPAARTWWLVFLDDSDQAGALAYHDLTNDGFPISKVFVKTILAAKSSVSVGATHELCEMAVDPWLNSAYQDPKGTFWAGEVCDPVEDDQYGYSIGTTLVTDFVTPNWFAHQHAQTAMDLKGHARSAFEVLSGGYAQKFDPTHGWQQVTGSKAAQSAYSKAEPGSRRERRSRKTERWERSDAKWERTK